MRDDGYFPPGSVLRMVHEERAVGLLYGQRALGIGAIAPLNFYGTISHTRGRERPFRRLAHTGKVFETVFFGSRAEADRMLALVHRMHEDVEGVLPEDIGPVPAGTPYSALDPEEMLWTVAVMADSARCFYELFVRRLDPGERDRLWADYVRFGELFGMARSVAPASHAEFEDYWRAQIEGDRAYLTDDARFVGSAIMFEIPVPLLHQPSMQVHNLVMLGSLPERIRELYGLRFTAAQAAAFRVVVAAARASRPLTPPPLRRGYNTLFFDLVANTEKARAAAGRPVPGALA